MSTEVAARQRFLNEYRQIRHAEGRGSDDPAYYRALPFRDLSGKNAAMWAMRARTFRYFERRILDPLAATVGRPLKILDLGSGNCWMSHQLSLRGHRPCAVDFFLDARDGLAAARHYERPFPAVGAEFDRLPLRSASIDLAVFNASLHYSTDYEKTLAEVRRCLHQNGLVVILDSPIYRRHEDGERMVAEKHADFQKRYGFRSDAIPSIEFLDEPGLQHLSRALELDWTIYKPWYGWNWHLRPLKARIQNRRPPSRFWILVGRFGRA
jgi:SAM-dependent methyltransferase